MKTRKTVQKTIRLDVVVNLRNRLFKKQQERSHQVQNALYRQSR